MDQGTNVSASRVREVIGKRDQQNGRGNLLELLKRIDILTECSVSNYAIWTTEQFLAQLAELTVYNLSKLKLFVCLSVCVCVLTLVAQIITPPLCVQT